MFIKRFEHSKIKELELIAEQRGTPFYYFDILQFSNNISYLRECFSDNIKICFSVKSNPFMAKYGVEYADLIEVCSYGELLLCKSQGIQNKKIVIGGIYKSQFEIEQMVDLSPVRISIESKQQLEILSNIASSRQKHQNVILRLSSGNQFGMELDEIVAIINRIHEYPYITICGLHYYSGTQKKQISSIKQDIAALQKAISKCRIDNIEIEYGPGIGVPFSYDLQTKWFEEIFSFLIESVEQLARAYPVTLEFGRLLTADIGVYVTKIVEIKQNAGRSFYIVDGGINHLNYYGQINGVPNPSIWQKGMIEPSEEVVTICGPLCTANDILAKDIKLVKAKVGDLIFFENAGAYSATESRSLFLSHPLPTVIIGEGDRIIETRTSKNTYTINMSDK